MEWKKIGKSCYEAENENFYFHLRKEDRDWYLDIFENNKPFEYIETFTFDSLKEAKKDAENYIPYIK